MFEKATRMKLRVPTIKGNLSVEDLWDLPLQELNVIAKAAYKRKEENDVDYLDDVCEDKKDNDENTLIFDITLHIIETKKKEIKDRKESFEKKSKREKLLTILAKKRDSALDDMSEEELLKKLEELT